MQIHIYSQGKRPNIKYLFSLLSDYVRSFQGTNVYDHLKARKKINLNSISFFNISSPKSIRGIQEINKNYSVLWDTMQSNKKALPRIIFSAERETFICGILYFFKSIKNVNFFCGDFSDDSYVVELQCNLDNVTSEEISTYQKAILKLGALDVWVENILMKKSRPSFKICILLEKRELHKFQIWVLQNIPTLGIRYHILNRLIMLRYKDGNKKFWFTPDGSQKEKIEHSFSEKIFLKK